MIRSIIFIVGLLTILGWLGSLLNNETTQALKDRLYTIKNKVVPVERVLPITSSTSTSEPYTDWRDLNE